LSVLGQKPAKTAAASKETKKYTATKAVDKVKDAGGAVTDTVEGWFK